jgi:hypothetical protein
MVLTRDNPHMKREIVPMSSRKTTGKIAFQTYVGAPKESMCFVLMPFRPELNEIYEDVVKPVITQAPLNLECVRADEIYGTDAIMGDIW